MNIAMLTNMLSASSFGLTAVPPKSTALGNTDRLGSRSVSNSVDNLTQDNVSEKTPRTDNVAAVAGNELVAKSPQEFRHALGKKIAAETAKGELAETESKNQVEIAGALPAQQNSIQPVVVYDFPAVVLGEAGTAIEMSVNPQSNQEPNQLLTGSSEGESPFVTEQIATPVGNKYAQPPIDKGQFSPQTLSTSNSVDLPDSDTPQTENRAEVEVQTPSKAPTSTKGLINKEIGEELTSEATNSSNKTSIVGQRPVLSNNSFVETKEKSPITEEKPPDGQEKSAVIATKPPSNKVNTGQQNQILSESFADAGKESSLAGNNSSSDILLKNFNPSQFQMGVKKPANSVINDSANSDSVRFEQILPGNNSQPSAAEQTSAFSPAVKTTGNTSPGNAFTSIGEQIQGYISSSVRQGDRQVTIHLNPPELGKVSIKFREEGNQITGLLEVSKAQTRYEIQQALPLIAKNLADCGIAIKRLEVVLADQPEQQTFKEQSLQDGSFQQHGSGKENNLGSTITDYEWMTNISGYQGTFEQPDMFVTDKSINMLI